MSRSMAKMQFEGIDEYVAMLKRLGGDTRELCGRAIYAGADVVADAVRSQIGTLPVAQKYAKSGEKINTITAAQKAGLLAGLGIARMKQEGTGYNVKVGFDGYNSQRTKAHPGGQPNAMIARSVCSGTSFRQKNDFVGRAARSAKGAAEAAMQKALDEELDKRTL